MIDFALDKVAYLRNSDREVLICTVSRAFQRVLMRTKWLYRIRQPLSRRINMILTLLELHKPVMECLTSAWEMHLH